MAQAFCPGLAHHKITHILHFSHNDHKSNYRTSWIYYESCTSQKSGFFKKILRACLITTDTIAQFLWAYINARHEMSILHIPWDRTFRGIKIVFKGLWAQCKPKTIKTQAINEKHPWIKIITVESETAPQEPLTWRHPKWILVGLGYWLYCILGVWHWNKKLKLSKVKWHRLFT